MGEGNAARKDAYLENDDEKKVYVGDIVELQPEVLRNKAQWSVLSSPDLVPGELYFVVPLLILSVVGQGNVEEDPPLLLLVRI